MTRDDGIRLGMEADEYADELDRFGTVIDHHGCAEELRRLAAQVEAKNAVLQEVLNFCEFAWRDVPMNDYAFERLNQAIAIIQQQLGE